MRFWRIARDSDALDKSCAGTRAAGGRWNPPGIAALYAGTTVEICALEKFVHTGALAIPLVLVSVDVPDDPMLGCVAPPAGLPAGWNNMPTSDSAQKFGARFLARADHLYMKVPSVIVPEALNVLINPMHKDYNQVRLAIARPFTFDRRMLKP